MKNKRWLLTAVVCLLAKGAMAQEIEVRKFSRGVVVLNSGDTLRGPLTYYLERDVLVVQPPGQLPQTLTAASVQSFVTNVSSTPMASTLTKAARPYTPTLSRGGEEPEKVPILQRLPATAALPARVVRPDSVSRHQYVALKWPAELAQQHGQTFGFFELLALGKATLVQRTQIREYSTYAQSGYTPPAGINGETATNTLSRFNKAPHLYQEVDARERVVKQQRDSRDALFLINASGQMQQVSNAQKEVLLQFPAQSRVLNAYVQAHKLSWHNPADVARVVAYANSL